MNSHYQKNTECNKIQPQLGQYMENALSAREMWSLEKHLTNCSECSRILQEMQMTVSLLHSTPRLDTSNDFMAKLHARLDGFEPEITRPSSLAEVTRDWLMGVFQAFQRQRAPAMSLGMALTLCFAMLIVTRQPKTIDAIGTDALNSNQVSIQKQATLEEENHAVAGRDIALTASNSFDDPAAMNLRTHSELNEKQSEEPSL